MIEALIKQYLRLILDISGGLRMWRVLRFDNKKCNLSKTHPIEGGDRSWIKFVPYNGQLLTPSASLQTELSPA